MPKREKTTFGQRIIESADEAVRIGRGETKPARVSRHRYRADAVDVAPPPRFRSRRVRAIRNALNVSQPVFAAALNVSVETVRAWEQGKREPDGPTLRLLELAQQHPDVFLEKIRSRAHGTPRDRASA